LIKKKADQYIKFIKKPMRITKVLVYETAKDLKDYGSNDG